jgi:hypothetical protein
MSHLSGLKASGSGKISGSHSDDEVAAAGVGPLVRHVGEVLPFSLESEVGLVLDQRRSVPVDVLDGGGGAEREPVWGHADDGAFFLVRLVQATGACGDIVAITKSGWQSQRAHGGVLVVSPTRRWRTRRGSWTDGA